MSHMDITVRLSEGDTLVVDGEVFHVDEVGDDWAELRLPGTEAAAGGRTKAIERVVAGADTVSLYR